ncbi:response regulator [Ilyomonas limi]|uniref:Response regulator n=1 Tax=Ilyomonas limi TaxID=2575867 RepID=A0A4U3L5F4_9BACT|nr:response regulator [Ilyomonas limi]TKK68847.1 response regulator [Ilyomonas limi]
MNNTDILYIEDNEDYIGFVIRALKKVDCNINVSIATDGKTALSTVSDTSSNVSYKLILLDIHLPGMTGIELVQKMRAQKALAYTPIIMFSTSDNPKDVEACYKYGANAYLVKPVGIQPLVNTLKSVCDFWLNCNYSCAE